MLFKIKNIEDKGICFFYFKLYFILNQIGYILK